MSADFALRKLLKPHRTSLVAASAVACVDAVPALLTTLAVGRAVDALKAGSEGSLDRWALVIAILAGVAACTRALRMVAVDRAAFRLEADLRQRYFDHVLVLGLERVESTAGGQLVARGTADLRAVRTFMTGGLPIVTQVATGLVFVIVVAGREHPGLGLAVILPAVGVLLALLAPHPGRHAGDGRSTCPPR